MSGIQERDGAVLLAVKVVPGSSRERIVGWLGEALKVAVAAPPEKGRANAALIRLLADALGLRPNDLEVRAGAASPRKTIAIRGRTAGEVRKVFGG